MKQHITQKQLDELSISQFDKLNIWYHQAQNLKRGQKPDPKMLLSIGRMMEVLNEHSGEDIANFSERAVKVHTVGKPWHHWFTIHWDQEYKELCDALWEATKEVLNK